MNKPDLVPKAEPTTCPNCGSTNPRETPIVDSGGMCRDKWHSQPDPDLKWLKALTAEPQAREPHSHPKPSDLIGVTRAAFDSLVEKIEMLERENTALHHEAEGQTEEILEFRRENKELRECNEELTRRLQEEIAIKEAEKNILLKEVEQRAELERQNKELTEALRNVRECKQVVTARGIAFKALRGAQRKD